MLHKERKSINLPIIKQIQVKYGKDIDDERFNRKIVYEGYRPCTLHLMLDYINFCLSFRNVLPNKVFSTHSLPCYFYKQDFFHIQNRHGIGGLVENTTNFLETSNISDELKAYYNTDMQTDLPARLDQAKILIFDSNFECGNLGRVSINSLNEYNLFLKPDTNTKGNTQWFYFAVSNTFKDKIVTFNILNCSKSSGLFNKGMKPLAFSEKEYESNKTQWIPDTFNIIYLKNGMSKHPLMTEKTYWTLTFSYRFKHTGDKVYFAYNQPYTLSMLFLLLNNIKQKLLNNASHVSILDENGLNNTIKEYTNTDKTPTETINIYYNYSWLKPNDIEIKSQGLIYRQETLCRSYCGIPISLITITNLR